MVLWRSVLIALFASLALPASAQTYGLQIAAAGELQDICQQDRRTLWGADLCGPLIVVDPATRQAWASQTDYQGVLRPGGDGWIGELPAGVPIANSAVDWAGVRWIMLMGPLPEDQTERRVLVAHEAWHRIQNEIGLAAAPSDNAHLETERGRTLMRLELRALATALLSRGRGRDRAARDALAFRLARHADFPNAAANEAALDRNEGLAAYTGVRLGAGEDAAIYAARTLGAYDAHEAFARAYAYASGPAYGLLLDAERPRWRTQLGAYAPADLLAEDLNVTALPAREFQRRAARYRGPEIAAEEAARAAAQATRIAALRARFGAGPRLELPLAQMQFEFDPNAITPVEGLGSVYRTLTLRDSWGELRATEGALIDPSFTRLIAAEPGPGALFGPGWSLRLAPGYRIEGPDGAGIYRPLYVPPAE